MLFMKKTHQIQKVGFKMAISKAAQKANAKYVKNNYDTIITRVPKGKKQVIKDFATSKGKSLNEFVNEAIDEKMAQEK